MHPVVILGHVVDGVQFPKKSHRDLGNCEESLSGELPATPKQPPVGVVGPNRDGEERVKNVYSSVLVATRDHELCEPRDGGHLSHDAAQERVETLSIPEVGQEGGIIGSSQSEPGQHIPDKIHRESAGPEDLSH